MKIIFAFSSILLCFPLFAADKYPVSAIADSIKANANVVYRLDEQHFSINNLKSTTLKRHFVITILNEYGEHSSNLMVNYDNLHKVSNIDGALYDAEGKQLRKLKAKEIVDESSVSEINLIDDSRVKYHNFYNNRYPYTIEYSYEVNYNHTFFFPSWIPINSEKTAIEKSIFTVDFETGYDLKYYSFNLDGNPFKENKKNRTFLTWKIEQAPAKKFPEYFAHWRNAIPVLFIAPTDFQIENIKGNMNNWEAFGSFFYKLNEGKDKLPDNIKGTLHSITKNIADEKEKVKTIYSFMQQNTRYISIQLGIGGWVPFEAAYVANKGYGDCKALTNYTYSLLKEAGIKSHYALVYAGRDAIDQQWVLPEFTSNQFNHVILCVPVKSDTIWLECTSQYLPAGYVSQFTANRKALLVKEDGGALVSTPRYGIDENKMMRRAMVVINENGTADIKVETHYKGVKQDNLFSLNKAYSPQKMKEYLVKNIALNSFELNAFSYGYKDSIIPSLIENLDITANNFATVSGKRIFLTPNILSKYPYNIDFDESRLVDFHFMNEYSDSDFIEIDVPSGYELEASIKPVSLSTEFGRYSIESKMENGKLIFKRSFEQYKAQIPVSEQQKVVDFYKKIYTTDRSRVVLVKK